MRITTPLPGCHTGSYEFHISRAVRDRCAFDHSIYSLNGNVLLADHQAVQAFTQQLNKFRTPATPPFQAGHVNAMGLIDEILHIIIGLYREQVKPTVLAEALDWLDGRLGQEAVDTALSEFSAQFPPLAVYREEIPLADYLEAETNTLPNRQIALEELLMLWLANVNPAFSPYKELFDDTSLDKKTAYLELINQLDQFFNYQPTFGPHNQQLITMLRSPALASPHSLTGQLDYIRQHWFALLGDFLSRLLTGLDLIAEEETFRFGGPGPAEVIDFNAWDQGDAPERFSEDSDWMPRLVLLAKNAYVWLDQLTSQYQRPITRLDQIPDEELDRLASQGITGLWLIGLWERSAASRRIKQVMGDPDAIASAYSLNDYNIAHQLGGPESLDSDGLPQAVTRPPAAARPLRGRDPAPIRGTQGGRKFARPRLA